MKNPIRHIIIVTIAILIILPSHAVSQDKPTVVVSSHMVNFSDRDKFIEDTDEYFLHLPESVLVFKTREAGNFDFAVKKWIGSKRTVRMV